MSTSPQELATPDSIAALHSGELLKQGSEKKQTEHAPEKEKSEYQKRVEQKYGVKIDFDLLEPGTKAADGTEMGIIKTQHGEVLTDTDVYSSSGVFNLAYRKNFLGGQRGSSSEDLSQEAIKKQRARDKELATPLTAGTVYQTASVSIPNEASVYLFSDFEMAKDWKNAKNNTHYQKEILEKGKGKFVGNLKFFYDRNDYSTPRMVIVENMNGEVERMLKPKPGEKLTTDMVMEKLLIPYKNGFMDDEETKKAREKIAALANMAPTTGLASELPTPAEQQQAAQGGIKQTVERVVQNLKFWK